MGVQVNCDGCGRDADDECYCAKCAAPKVAAKASSVADDLEAAVGDLAAAIRRGDTSEAEYLLDRVAAEIPGWSDRVSIGRYSPMARAA